MKKLFAILMALSLLLSLAACGKTEPTEAPTEAPSEAPATEAPTDASTDAPTEAVAELSPIVGVYNGNSYSNTVLGISCDLSEEWTLLDLQDLIDAYGYTTDEFTDENIKSAVESAGSLTTYYAARNDGLQTLTITVASSAAYGYLEGKESSVVEMMIPQMETQLPASGIEVQSIDSGVIDFAGHERSCISVVGSANETDLYEKQVITFSDGYLFVITAVSFLEDSCDELLSNFTALAE